ncbi:MAG: type II toxin-antitoxin system RelB/DinJ family antitoxin [Firmicutes bacterium]|nr:type II toxin-antitoxin system RelB/DinJ family antitoxin [Bacillota bacterium]
MAQINIRVDDDVKARAEALYSAMGLTVGAAVTAFLMKSLRTGGLPFALTTVDENDPFYSESNMNHLKKVLADAEAGRNMHYHELIEVEDDEEAVA